MHIAIAVGLAVTLGASSLSEDYRNAAREIADGLSGGSAEALDGRLDVKALVEIATKDIDAPRDFKSGFLAGAMKAGVKMGASVVRTIESGGSVKVLKVRNVDGKPRALIRILSSPAGVNYIDLVLGRDASGRVVVTDMFPYLMGEMSSATIRRMYLLALAQADRGLLERMFKKKGDDQLKHLGKLKEMKEATERGQSAEALEIFQGVPESAQKERPFMVLYVTAASSAGEGEYLRALERFEKVFPGDPALDLWLIDAWFMRKRWEDGVKCVDRLHGKVEDPYLRVLKATFLAEQGDLAGARKSVGQAMSEEPSLLDAYWTATDLSMKAGDFKETGRLLDAIEANFEIELKDLATVPEYAPFVSSAEYKKWLKRRARP